MKPMTLLLLAGLALFLGIRTAAATPSACDAVTNNLVVNCGFETGTYYGWFFDRTSGAVSLDEPSARSGQYGVSLGPGLQSVSQYIHTIANDTYTLSFWASNTASGTNMFTVGFGDDLSLPFIPFNSPAFSYTEYTHPGLTASSSLSFLKFNAENVSGSFRIDDISVVDTTAAVTPPTSVPEPASAPMFGLGLAGIGFMLMWKRREHKGDRTNDSE